MFSFTADPLYLVYRVLAEHSCDNPITAKQLSKELGINDVEGCPTTRKLIEETMRAYDIPIGASSKGFYFISDRFELQEYVDNLQARIKGIQHRIETVKQAYRDTEVGGQ